jgi:cell division septal protein FtsQ
MYEHSRLTSRQSKKFEINKKTKAYLQWTLLLLMGVLFVVSVSRLSSIRFLSIRDIEIRGTTGDIVEISNKLIRTEISGNYIGLLSKSNIFLYPHDRLVKLLNDVSPKIKSVTIVRQGLGRIVVNIVEKTPVATVCAKLPDVLDEGDSFSNLEDCYLVDSFGFIFDRTASSSANLNHYYMPALSLLETDNNSLIAYYATSSAFFSELQNLYNGAIKSKLNPKSFLVKDGDEYEMYIDDTVVYFNNLRSLDEQLANLVAFWEHALTNGKNPGKYEYIDIRYGSNVFYR